MSFSITIADIGAFDAWRHAARRAISHQIEPKELDWASQKSLFVGQPLPETDGVHKAVVTRNFLDLARNVVWHSDAERFHLLYEALWRISMDEGDPLSSVDPLGNRLMRMAKNIGRDLHKMHAFLRFREVTSGATRRRFMAWFEPDHHIVEPASDFFVSRFSDMDWTILTPNCTAVFEDGRLNFQPGAQKPDLPSDASEALWQTYFTNIFNPARTNVRAMLSEMPKKYWRNLPETQLIPEMLKEAEARVNAMAKAQATQPRKGSDRISQRYRSIIEKPVGEIQSMVDLNKAVRSCQRCNLCEQASQAVCGEGPENVDLMIVGEQPGDREDLSGRPFVGPAGQLLRKIMHEVQIEPEKVWLTNAVKHFKFVPRGKRRLHQSPNRHEIDHCRWWLQQEISLVKPRIILALGASAAYALTLSNEPISKRRGRVERSPDGAPPILFSWHPSHILRLPEKEHQTKAERELACDLKKAGNLIATSQEQSGEESFRR